MYFKDLSKKNSLFSPQAEFQKHFPRNCVMLTCKNYTANKQPLSNVL